MVYLAELSSYMSPGAKLAALCTLAAILIFAGVRIVSKILQGDPVKRERKRRLYVHLNGRLGDALITEANETVLYYSYSVRGVQYTASQEVATLRDRLPAEPERLIGPVSFKYWPKNPANSILLCEEWSGLRVPSRAA
jgi:hypothetical protein